jgi:uncharacterized membrane protein
MPRRRQRGGEDLLEDAALVGLGAYAARNPQTPGMGMVANIGTYALYAMIAIFVLIVLFFLYAVFFGKRTEKLTMQCRPEDTPEERGGVAGCRTGSGNWYASSTA